MSETASAPAPYDVLLVGGGLQSALVALALFDRRPGVRVALVERGAQLGGEHTWCFHAEDVPAEARAFVEPLVEHRWRGYEVRFHDSTRQLEAAYSGLTSAHLDRVVRGAFEAHPASELFLQAEAVEVGADSVRLADGRELRAPLVLDARGLEPEADAAGRQGAGLEKTGHPSAGFQKFVGRELELREEHGLELPIVMDATVDQGEGYRFFYVLPLGPRRVLVEDTRFADTPTLDRHTLGAEIDAYAAAHGLDVTRVVRTEVGVLPMPWEHHPQLTSRSPFALGYRGGWMHPATGYSFPLAVRIAQLVAEHPDEGQVAAGLRGLAGELAGQLRFARVLNGLLFRWFQPADRHAVFERFYGLPAAVIQRFYALASTPLDRVRILVGKPPRGFSLRARLTAARRFRHSAGNAHRGRPAGALTAGALPAGAPPADARVTGTRSSS